MKRSCLNCSKYLTCPEKSKGPKYICDSFEQTKLGSVLGLMDLELEPSSPTRRVHTLHPSMDRTELPHPSQSSEDILDSEDPDSNEFYDAMRRSYDPLTRTVRDLRLDDSDFPLAHNVHHLFKKVLGTGIKMPFARQFWIMYQTTGEYCPRCADPRLKSIENVEVDDDTDEIAERASLLIHGICPKCKTTKGEMILNGELNDYNQLLGVLGQRSGKSMISNMLSGYSVHRMLKAPRLSTLCRGIQDFTPLTATFVALSFTRAVKLLWNPFNELVKGSSWFQEYHSMLTQSGKRYGVEFIKDNKNYLWYGHKNIEVYPLGPLKRALRGDTRYLASVDELGWFKYDVKTAEQRADDDEADDREIANADEVHAALENSLLTVRAETYTLYKQGIHHIPTGLLIATSSPASWHDKICRLLKENEGSTQTLGVRKATWEINPTYTEDHPYIVEQYKRNFAKAERDYGANPPQLASERYKPELIQTLFTGSNAYRVEQVHTDNKIVYGRTVLAKGMAHPTEPAVLALDAGHVDNSFAFALGHLRYPVSLPISARIAREDLSDRDSPTLVVSAIGEVIPRNGYAISFPEVYKHLISRLVRDASCCYVVADRWNSLMLLQSVEAQFPDECFSLQYSLRKEDFTAFDTDYINASKIQFPRLELEPNIIEAISDYKSAMMGKPASHLYLQFRTVMEARGVVMKGDGFTDDIYRSVVLLATAIRIPKIAKVLAKARLKRRVNKGRVQVFARGRSVASVGRE